MAETTWRLVRCVAGGSQWSEPNYTNLPYLVLNTGMPCDFSGCSCQGKGIITLNKNSATREEASDWFKRS